MQPGRDKAAPLMGVVTPHKVNHTKATQLPQVRMSKNRSVLLPPYSMFDQLPAGPVSLDRVQADLELIKHQGEDSSSTRHAVHILVKESNSPNLLGVRYAS